MTRGRNLVASAAVLVVTSCGSVRAAQSGADSVANPPSVGGMAQAEITQAREALTAALVARAKAQSKGGADSVEITSTHQRAGMVDVAGTYRAWSGIVSQTNPDGATVTARPTNMLDFTATMTRDNHSTWVMTKYHFSFHPGSEP